MSVKLCVTSRTVRLRFIIKQFGQAYLNSIILNLNLAEIKKKNIGMLNPQLLKFNC